MLRGIVIGFLLATAILTGVFSSILLRAWRQLPREIHQFRLRRSLQTWP
jgi:hypothetical protein